MVKNRWIAAFLATCLLLSVVTSAVAVTYLFQVEKEVVNVFVLKDGTAAIEYTIDFLNDPSADPIDFVDIGMPNGWYDLNRITAEIDGKPISHIKHSEYVTPGVELGLGSDAIPAGQRGQVHVSIGKVERFLFKNNLEGKGEYASFNFVPNFFGSQYVKGRTNIEVNLILPEGMTEDQPVYYTPRNWPGNETPVASIDDQGRVVYQWTTDNGNIAAEYQFGGGFPASLVPAEVLGEKYDPGPSGGSTDWGDFLCVGLFVAIFGILGILVVSASRKANQKRKQQYLPPKVSIEGHGVKRGLTAVEAAILMQEPLDKVLTMILFGVVKKGAAAVVSKEPLELKVEPNLPAEMRAYELDFLKAFGSKPGRERSRILQEMFVDLVQSVSQKMKGFSRQATIDYYKSITDKAWQYVMAAETPAVKMDNYDEALDWTMLDENYDDKTRKMFGDRPVVVTPPSWWWRMDPTYRPIGSGGTSTAAGPVSGPGLPSHTPSTAMPSQGLPGANWAAEMVNTVQNVSASTIGNLQTFTGGVTNRTNPMPAPVTYSGGRSGGGGGGHSCACACACAGCACACAGGGR